MSIRLGDLLVKHNVLTAEQRDAVVSAQRGRCRPFGVLAEEMFGVHPKAVERAWAEQFALVSGTVDPRGAEVDPELLRLFDRRQAWQFRVLPIAREDGEIVICTSSEHLARAMKFAGWKLDEPCGFVIADPLALGEAMCRWYPMPGMTAEMVGSGFGPEWAGRYDRPT